MNNSFSKGLELSSLKSLIYHDQHVAKICDISSKFKIGLVKDQRENNSGYLHTAHFDLFVDGEFYDLDLKELATIESAQKVIDRLKLVDGYFSAVLYCRHTTIISIITDRFGLKPLYIWKGQGQIAWASELKAIIGLNGFAKTYDKHAISAYLKLGYLPGNKTWFNDVELLPASSVTIIDGTTSSVSTSRYWSWGEMKKNHMCSLKEATTTMGNYLQQAVDKRLTPGTTLALSGGLDSRTIAYHSNKENPLTFSFGFAESNEIILAKKVAQALDLEHKLFDYTDTNWLDDRIGSVWRTEGMMPFFHLHSAPFCKQFKEIGNTVLNGFGGATLMGGLFIGKIKKLHEELERYIDIDYDFYAESLPESLVIDQHMRRFINQGSIDVGKYLIQRKPFMDFQLLSFVLGLPEQYRKYYRLFQGYMRNDWPTSLLNIPWEKSGFSPRKAIVNEWQHKLNWPAIRRKLGMRESVFKYSELANHSFWHHVQTHYLNDTALIWSVIPSSYKDEYIKHLHSNFQVMGRLLSLEIWLRLINDQITPNESFTRI